MASHLKIRTEKTGHYYAHGNLSETTKYVWICLHGYGQLAKYFIQRFEFLDPSIHLVIAPEGLNRFYFEGLNDRPVATWMTSEDRLDEIADFIGFLESLRKKIRWDKNENIKVIYFGFSQGVTTLLRWLVDAAPRADYMLLWAGGIADDILYDHRKDYFKQIEAHYFLGDGDPYFTLDRFDTIKAFFFQNEFDIKLHQFSGQHKVEESVLKQWVDQNLKR